MPAFSLKRYEQDFARLEEQELPYFVENAACGHCGARADDSDADWLDFRIYVQFKALLRQIPVAAWCAPSPSLCAHVPRRWNTTEVHSSGTQQ